MDAKYHRDWYQKNKERIRGRKLKLQAERKQKLTDTVREYKRKKGCADCGITNPLVLDLDHRDPKEKVYAISELIRRGTAFVNLMVEIKKCDVVCANCHRIRTSKQFSWHV